MPVQLKYGVTVSQHLFSLPPNSNVGLKTSHSSIHWFWEGLFGIFTAKNRVVWSSTLQNNSGQQYYGVYGGGRADTGVPAPADTHIWLQSESINLASGRLRTPVTLLIMDSGHHPLAA